MPQVSLAQTPVVTAVAPARNSVVAPVAGPVQVQLSQPVAAGTIGNLRIFGSQRQGRRAGTLNGGGTASLRFQPAQAFAPGEQVSVTVPATVLGTSGAAARPEVYQFTAAAGTGPADFAGGPLLPMSAVPYSVATGDLDNDGDQDLLAPTGGTVGIWLNDGAGIFTATTGLTAPAGGALNTVVPADVDADGRLDLVAMGNGVLYTWHNTGNGFTLAVSLTLNGVPSTPILADVDADGDLDALLANPGYRTVHVCFNNGAGTFSRGTDVPIAENMSSIAVADLDNDGDLDFVGVATINYNYTDGVANVRLNNGNGAFTNAPDVRTGAYSNNVAVGDLDGDGDVDFVVSNQIRPASVLLNNGNATFTAAPDVDGRDTTTSTLADVDGDGDLDLLRTVPGNNLVALNLNDGTGHFGATSSRPAGNRSYGLAVADLDGDQAVDFVMADAVGNSLSLRFNRIPPPVISSFAPGSGPVGSPVAITGAYFGLTTAVLFNGSAAAFVVSGPGSITATVPPGAASGPLTVTTLGGTTTSTGSFTVTGPPAPVVLSRSPARHALAAAPGGAVALTFSAAMAAATAGELRVWGNRSAGRRPDAVGGGGATTLRVQPARAFLPGEVVQVSVPPGLHSSSGAAARPETYQFTTASGPGLATFAQGGDVSALPRPELMQPGDFDGDGDLDLVVSVPTGLQIFTNNGRGVFAPGLMVATYTRPTYGSVYIITVADLDNDGDLDLVAGGGYYRNDGNSFAQVLVPALGNGGNVEAGDLDADGDLDLLVLGPGVAEGTVTLNDGAGGFGPARVFSLTQGGADRVRLADVDNDGDLDALSISKADQTAWLCRNNGAAGFSPPERVLSIVDPVDLNLADLDGDGDLDLVLVDRNELTNSTLVRYNDGQGHFGGGTQLPTYANIYALLLADLNGDAQPDIVLAAGSEARTLLNNGNGSFAPLKLVPTPGNAYGLSVEDYNGDGALDIAGMGYNISSNIPFLALNQLPPPVITSFTPTYGLAGTVVTVTGQYFINVLNVELNGTQVSNLVVNSPTSLTFTVPAGATTGYIYLYTDHGYCQSPTVFEVSNVPPNLDVYGPLDVTGTYNNVTVYQYYGTVANLVGPLTVMGTLTVRGGGTLRTNCQPITGPGNFVMEPYATLSICNPAGISTSGPTGAVQLTGTRTFANGYYTYNGTQAQLTGSGLPAQIENLTLDNPAGLTLTQPLALGSRLTLTHGNLTTSGQRLTLLSSLNRQAWVDNADGVVLGDATVQRFVLPYRNPGLGYRHFSAPITNATVSSLTTTGFTPVVNASYNSSATPGTITPFPTVFGYDQGRSSTVTSSYGDFDKGWVSPASLTDPLLPGRGYAVNMSAGRTVSFTGPLHNGSLTLPLTRAALPVADGGWQLLGNPYPSPLDWSRLTLPAEVEPALYVVQSTSPYGGTYSRYVNGIGNPVLDVGQGFFVRLAQPGTSATLTLTNAARRYDASPTAFQRTTADLRPQLPLRLSDATGRADEVIVYFEAGATTAFAPAFDARQLVPNMGGEPSVWAVASSGEALSIYGLPPIGPGTARVPLGVVLPQAGTFTFSAPALANMAGLSVWLDDAATGQRTQFSAGTSYAFSAAAGLLAGRFSLRFEPVAALATPGAALAVQVDLYPNPAHRSATLALPAGLLRQPATVQVCNALGQVMYATVVPATPAARLVQVETASWPTGLYLVQVKTGEGTLARRLAVE